LTLEQTYSLPPGNQPKYKIAVVVVILICSRSSQAAQGASCLAELFKLLNHPKDLFLLFLYIKS
jgi:hypothetical protein